MHCPQTVKQSSLTDNTCSRTHTDPHARTHRNRQDFLKKLDKLRQNILRPMQAPTAPEAELRQQGCTAPMFGMLVCHVFTVS